MVTRKLSQKPSQQSSVANWVNYAQSELLSVGIESAILDAILLLGYVLRKDRAWLSANPNGEISPEQQDTLESLLLRRLKREPLAYIIGYKEFYCYRFKVTPAVLIPRPETEIMVEYAINNFDHNNKLLELGTGSGCIAISINKHRPDLKITATDISAEALKIAKYNSTNYKTAIKFVHSNLFDNIDASDNRFSVILANLPYVPTDARVNPELSYEPKIALYGGRDGLDIYRKFFDESQNYLLPDGQIIIEAGPTQRQSIKKLTKAKYEMTEISEYIWSFRLL